LIASSRAWISWEPKYLSLIGASNRSIFVCVPAAKGLDVATSYVDIAVGLRSTCDPDVS
jgi:hypothetical protein